MKFSKYLRKEEAETKWKYTGTIWGDSYDYIFTSDEVASMVIDMGYDGKMIDHPTYSRKSGYYLQSNDIWYSAHLIEECVLERVD